MVTAIPKCWTKILPQIPLNRLGKPEEIAGPDHLPLFQMKQPSSQAQILPSMAASNAIGGL
jgi:hypothetical protein